MDKKKTISRNIGKIFSYFQTGDIQMSNKGLERCSASWNTREGITPSPIKRAKIKRLIIPRAGEDVKQLELSDIAGESVIGKSWWKCLAVYTDVELLQTAWPNNSGFQYNPSCVRMFTKGMQNTDGITVIITILRNYTNAHQKYIYQQIYFDLLTQWNIQYDIAMRKKHLQLSEKI